MSAITDVNDGNLRCGSATAYGARVLAGMQARHGCDVRTIA
jgi:hypothetical protein